MIDRITYIKEKINKKTLILLLCGVLLFIACLIAFYKPQQTTTTTRTMSEKEERLCAVLSEIDGVGEIYVYVNEDNEGNSRGVIVVFDGADNLFTRLDVMKAASNALSVKESDVLIYRLK